jgi:hypothetical protein
MVCSAHASVFRTCMSCSRRESDRGGVLEKAYPHCKVRCASWGCATTRKKYEAGLQYQSAGIFGSTCTRCGKGKKDHYQYSDGKNYCAPASANAGQAPASSANAAAGSPVNQKCCVVT